MNATHHETPATSPTPGETTTQACGSIVGALVDVGATWAAYGLKVGKLALVASAETLGKTAQALDAIAAGIEKAKSAADPASTEGAPTEPTEPAPAS